MRLLKADKYSLLLLPAFLLIAVAFAYPVFWLLLRSFSDPSWGLQNYQVALGKGIYLNVLWNTISIAGVTTFFCLLIGYPMAYSMVHSSPLIRRLLIFVVLIPFWTSILVRTFAWIVLLQRNGLINDVLLGVGVIQQSDDLIFNRFGVLRSFAKIHLVGFSLGGMIAQQVAIEAHDRLLSLALISPIAGRSEAEKQRVVARAELLEKEGAQAHLVAAGERWFSDDFRRANPEVIKKRRQQSLCNNPTCYVAAYRVLAENDLMDDLHKITTPTLAITGEFDAGSTPRMSNLIAQRVQHGKAIILPQLKHAVLLEAPTQIAARLEAFFASARN